MRGDWLPRNQPQPQIKPDEGLIWIWLPVCTFFFIFSLYFFCYACTSCWKVVTVLKLETLNVGSPGPQYTHGYCNKKYLIHTDAGIFECNNSSVYGIQNKEKFFDYFIKNQRYNVRVVGWDCEFLGWRRSVVSATKNE